MSVTLLVAQPWDRQENESPVAFEAFCAFRDMGSQRSVNAVGRLLAKSGSLLDKWAKAHRWQERARAFDIDQDRRMRAQGEQEHFSKLTAYRDRAERAAAVASEASILVMQKTIQRLQNLDAETIESGEIASLLRAAAQSLSLSLTAEAEAISVSGLERALREKMSEPEITP